MVDFLLYFAYGSNMLTNHLRVAGKVSSAQKIGVGYIENHRLTFHKVSKDGSGKCDAESESSRSDRVYGVLYKIAVGEKEILDRKEGLGIGYELKDVTVVLPSKKFVAFTYFATNKDPLIKPYAWYKDIVLAGAIEHRLPDDYIQMIKRVQGIADPCQARDTEKRLIFSIRNSY